jgi:hypothetical protein
LNLSFQVSININLVFSNRPVEIFSLNNENNRVIIGEWNHSNALGSHLSTDDEKKRKVFAKETDDYEHEKQNKEKAKTYFDNPKFHLTFANYDLSEVEFEVKVTRAEGCWGKKILDNAVNAMVGVYVFKYHKEKWRDMCINSNSVQFYPKNDINVTIRETRVNPEGYIIMPTTYGRNMYGPFTILVKCKEKIELKALK